MQSVRGTLIISQNPVVFLQKEKIKNKIYYIDKLKNLGPTTRHRNLKCICIMLNFAATLLAALSVGCLGWALLLCTFGESGGATFSVEWAILLGLLSLFVTTMRDNKL